MEKLGSVVWSEKLRDRVQSGIFAVEEDAGKPKRMYMDTSLRMALGASEELSPEELFAWWEARVSSEYKNSVYARRENTNAEHVTRVQYDWQHPVKGKRVLRADSVRNFSYTEGIRVEGIISDLTGELSLQEESKESYEKKLMAKLAENYDALFLIDPYTGDYDVLVRCEVELEEATSMKIHGDNFYEAAQRDGHTILHPEDAEQYMNFYTKEHLIWMVENDVCEETENRWWINGAYQWTLNKVVPLEKSEGKSIILLGALNTDEKHWQQERYIRALQKAESANKAKNTFLFNMSHDIRTPMNAIMGFTSMAEKNLSNPEIVGENLQKVKQASAQLLKLINDVLDMVRIESGKTVSEEENISLTGMMKEIQMMMLPAVQSAGLSLQVDFDGLQEAQVYADKLHITQILLNILDNAVKYTKKGGRIFLAARQETVPKGGHAKYAFIVEDTGIGMSEETKENIFELFVREQSATKSGVQGAGLGMAIVKRLVEQLQGEIFVESALGKGTQITVEFELRVAKECTEEAEPVLTAEAFDVTKLHGKKILLVEDNPLNREIALDLLEDEEMEVEEAEDGNIAVDVLKKKGPHYFDAVLMDIQMPCMDGYTATKAIRAFTHDDYTELPIIALTANAFEEDRRDALRAGMNAHLAKPVDVDALMKTLAEFIAV